MGRTVNLDGAESGSGEPSRQLNVKHHIEIHRLKKDRSGQNLNVLINREELFRLLGCGYAQFLGGGGLGLI